MIQQAGEWREKETISVRGRRKGPIPGMVGTERHPQELESRGRACHPLERTILPDKYHT